MEYKYLYYVPTMEKFALTCQTLYNQDLLDKKKEIIKLKNELAEQAPPTILYENEEEWNNLKIEAIKICQRGVRTFISDTEYPFMRSFGINPGQYEGLYLILYKAFNKISKEQANEWISNYAHVINLSIKNTIRSLVDMGLWESIFDSLGRDGLYTFILKILMEFFDETSSDPYDSIAVIRVLKCSNEDG